MSLDIEMHADVVTGNIPLTITVFKLILKEEFMPIWKKAGVYLILLPWKIFASEPQKIYRFSPQNTSR